MPHERPIRHVPYFVVLMVDPEWHVVLVGTQMSGKAFMTLTEAHRTADALADHFPDWHYSIAPIVPAPTLDYVDLQDYRVPDLVYIDVEELFKLGAERQ